MLTGVEVIAMRILVPITLPLLMAGLGFAQAEYDLLLKGGHVIDGRNKVTAVRDVAIKDGRIAAVAANIPAAKSGKVVDVTGLYVTPGLIDIHAHVYSETGDPSLFPTVGSVPPDGFTLRVGVTTAVDAGTAGWRNFPDFKAHVIDRARTRVLAYLNIAGSGMRGGKWEQDPEEMQAKPAADMALRHKGLVVGIKTAHYGGPDWIAVDRSVEAGEAAGLPVMVDFGSNRPQRPLLELLTKKLRPGDIYTHVYSGLRGELDENGRVSAGLIEGRKRGVLFDVGHGAGSFLWRVAVPAMKEGFIPDIISTDLHAGSMNAGMRDMLNVMSKFLAMGMPLDQVILRSTWMPAKAIRHEELGHLSASAPADIAVLRLERGDFGFLDIHRARLNGNRRLACEMTLRDGKIVYELNGLTRTDWSKLPAGYRAQGDANWDGFATRPQVPRK